MCIGLSQFLPWWQIGDGSTGMAIALREIEVCYAGRCEDVDTAGMYGMVSTATFVYGIAAIIALIFGGLMPALTSQPTRPAALFVSTMFLGFVGFTIGTMPDEVIELMGAKRTTWYWCAIGGPIAALVAPIASMIAAQRAGEGRRTLYRPPELAELDRAEAPIPASLAPPAERRKPPSMPMVSFAPVPGVAPTQPKAARAPIELDPEPAPPPAPAPAPERARRVSGEHGVQIGAVRFALAAAEVGDDLVIGIGSDGRRRELRWAELGGALARDLSDAPPFEDTPLVDLVPAGALPLRFVASTRVEFALGGASPDPRDRLRRLLALARAMNPELQLEAATAAFVDQKTALPTWSLRDLAQYDARYRQLR